MPELDGLQTAAQLRKILSVAVVFVTAYDEHALAAFDVGAVDYLLKPVSSDRLEETLTRLGASPAATPVHELAAASDRMYQQAPCEEQAYSPVGWLEVRQGTERRLFDPRRIQRLQASDKYVVFMDDKGSQQVLDTSLTQLEIQLASLGFVRVHRRELIRLSAIREMTTQNRTTEALLLNGERVKVSRRFAPKLRRLIMHGRAPKLST